MWHPRIGAESCLGSMDPVQEKRKVRASVFSPVEWNDAFLPSGMTRCRLPLQTVGESLLYMLEKCLGPAFTPAMRAAWSQLYGAVVQAMSRGWDGE